MNKSYLFGGIDVLMRLLSDQNHVAYLSEHTYTFGESTVVLRRKNAEGLFDVTINGSSFTANAHELADTVADKLQYGGKRYVNG